MPDDHEVTDAVRRTIALHPDPAGGPDRAGHSGHPHLTRRSFLKGTAVLTGTLASGSLLATLAPSRTWAAEMTVFDEPEAKKLLRLTQVIFPHENMPEAINALAVKDLDVAAAGDAGMADTPMAKAIRAGLVKLDEAAGGDWMGASPDAQLAAVEAIADSECFTTVRGRCITSLYDNDLAFAHFGYEGEAFSKGGYLGRGYDDLAWLPDPPEDASPSMFANGPAREPAENAEKEPTK